MPKPRPKETQSDFISRCMGDEEARRDHPEQKQRAGFCYGMWREHHGEKSLSESSSLIVADLHARESLLESRAKSPGRKAPQPRRFATPLSKDMDAPVAYYGEIAVEAEIDEEERTSRWRIVVEDGELDREGDSMLPEGCLSTLNRYRDNSVVYYDHQQNQMPALPVGTSMGPGKQFGIDVQPDCIYATCWHHCDTELGADVWNLVRKGILRGASPSFTPIQAEKIGQKSYGHREDVVVPRYRFLEWELLEWSICGIPVKPSALRVEMSAGRVKSEIMRKSFAAYAPRRNWSKGVELEQGAISVKEARAKLASGNESKSVSGKSAKETAMPTVKTAVKFPANLGAISFLKSKFTKCQAKAWLKKHDKSAALLEETKTAYVFAQKSGYKAIAKKALTAGIVLLLAKAMKPVKKDEEMEDEEEKDMPEVEVEKAEDEEEDDEDEEAEAKEDEAIAELEEAQKEEHEDKADDELNNEDQLPKKDETDEVKAIPPGLQTYVDRCNHAMGVAKYCKEMIENPALEHEGSKASMQKDLEENQAKIEQLHKEAAEHYPEHDFKALLEEAGFDNQIDKPDDEEEMKKKPDEKNVDEEDEDDTEEEVPVKKAVKKAVSKARIPRIHKSCIKAAADHMGQLAAHQDIPEIHKAGLLHHSKALNDVVAAMEGPAMVSKDDPEAVRVNEEKAMLAEIRRSQEAIKKALPTLDFLKAKQAQMTA